MMLVGPVEEQLLNLLVELRKRKYKDDNEDEAAGLTPEKISELFNDQVKPVMLSQFPDFQRKVIDLDESIKQDLTTYGFP